MNINQQPGQNLGMNQDPATYTDHAYHDSDISLGSATPLKPHTHAAPIRTYAMEIEPPTGGLYGSILQCFGSCFGGLGTILPCCCCCFSPFRQVEQGNVGMVTRFGKFYKIADPGLTKVLPLTERINYVNMQITVMDLPSQWCLTKDNVKVYLSSVVYYSVTDPYKCLYEVQEFQRALRERTVTTLRLVAGARTLQDIIERREEIAKAIQEIIDEVSNSWGIAVESILIKDISLPDDLQTAFAQAAMSKRIGESKIITARAEVESAKLMRKAADILESKAAMQIRYLDAMQNMAKSSNSKVIFMPSASAIESLAENLKNKANFHGGPSSSSNAANGAKDELPESGLNRYDQQQALNLVDEAVQQERALPQTIVNTESYY